MPLDRHPGQRAQISGRNPERSDVTPRGDVDEIGSDCPGGRQGAGTEPLQYHPADKITLGHHRVVHALDRGDRRRGRYHTGMDALLEPLLGEPRNAEKLDAIAEFLGKVDVEARYMADPLAIDPPEVDRTPEPDTSENGEL